MTDTDVNAYSQKDPESGFVWPSPAYFQLPNTETTVAPEPCVIDLLNGAQLTGRMVRLLSNEAQVEIQPAGVSGIQSIGYAEFARLTLTRPVVLRKREALGNAQPGIQLPDSYRQSFVIDYQSGGTFVGETVGFAPENDGLFLFLPEIEGRVVRCFVPKVVTQEFRIGELIGDILIEQKIASPEQVAAAFKEQRKLRAQRLGELLTEKQVVTPEALSAAIRHTAARPILRLGQALTALGLLSETELERALEQQKGQRKKPLGEILIDMGAVDRDTVRMVMAHKLGIPYVNLREFKVPRGVLALVPAALAWRHNILPIYKSDKELVIAVSDPTCMPFIGELRFVTGLAVIPAIADEQALKESISHCYSQSGEPVNQTADMDQSRDKPDNLAFYLSAGAEADETSDRDQSKDKTDKFAFYFPAGAEVNETSDRDQSKDKPDNLAFYRSAAIEAKADDLRAQLEAEGTNTEIMEDSVSESDDTLVTFVNKMMLDAHEQQASDIHVETYPGEKNIRVRFRKDGLMVDYMELPPKFRNAMLARIKMMARLDISKMHEPQDGRIDFKRFGPAGIELRVATMPTSNGLEDVVMRILAAVEPVHIDRLGMEQKELAELKQMLAKPNGLILVCGPAGSGKTTTLHSALSCINTPERKIWTAEDPIEITQQGLRQVQVDPNTGLTFAGALRSFLRLDPDVIMVGEMRDAETATIGLDAALAGHLVLSTLNTNGKVEGVVRLLDMGADPFRFADALLCVLSQRLARRLCPECTKPYAPSADEVHALAEEYCRQTHLDPATEAARWRGTFGKDGQQPVLYAARGCPACGQTGYKGRLGIHELLVASPSIKQQIQSRAPMADIVDGAVNAGMRTLRQHGIEKVLRGETDLHQVRAVCA